MMSRYTAQSVEISHLKSTGERFAEQRSEKED
jgi:hypothetical protein